MFVGKHVHFSLATIHGQAIYDGRSIAVDATAAAVHSINMVGQSGFFAPSSANENSNYAVLWQTFINLSNCFCSSDTERIRMRM